MNPYHHTIGELLDYLESIATHTPDANECDCHVCNMHGSICYFATKIGTIVRGSAE